MSDCCELFQDLNEYQEINQSKLPYNGIIYKPISENSLYTEEFYLTVLWVLGYCKNKPIKKVLFFFESLLYGFIHS